ncbi:MAG: RelE/StbE family addiction module toxin [Planctomycetota bacterium]|nr:MAG: RelE/StbE family addiction module toxin [Planctomycetota bacterium]
MAIRRYRIDFKPSAAKSFAKLPTDLQKRIVRAVELLADNPRPHGVVKMEGDDNLWRIRVGDFRVVYEIHDSVLLVMVMRVGHRREVYRG